MKGFPFVAILVTLANSTSSQETTWLWQFVDDEEKDGPQMRWQIQKGAMEIARMLHEGEGEGEGSDGDNTAPAPPTPALAQPTLSPPTPEQATPSPPTSVPPSPAQPTPPPTPSASEPTPSPPTLAAVATELAEAANAGQKIIQVKDVTGLAPGMSLTISDGINSETKTIIAVDGAVTLDSALEHSYDAAVSVTAIPQHEPTPAFPTPATPAPSSSGSITTTKVTTTSNELIDAADRTNPVTWTLFAMAVAMVWFSVESA